MTHAKASGIDRLDAKKRNSTNKGTIYLTEFYR